jgi:hypothetical protein
MRTLAIMALGLGLGGCANALEAQVQSIHALKVREAMNDYEKASSGAPLERCVKAKLVALAYEDARDPTSASAWHAREKTDCEAAMAAMGIERPTAD